ncbi:hypothetical protein AVEN_169010-1 [Araneus ventricosus]|uniref:Uncharacterized protein n=1 Tax=Araneus ventricosus TaxID=182803 RepID=A0A4Y2TXU9_ARAVE|nr:hypothetical protein AVEN_169010-1 [Araneus ventricosus]
MDRPQSQLTSKTVSNIEENNYYYHEGDTACSLLEMNELEIRGTRPDEIADHLDLCANDGVGNMKLESQEYRFAPDSSFILSQEGNPLGAGSSDCLVSVPPHVSDDKQEEIGNYWTLSSGSKPIYISESDLIESDIIKSNIHDLHVGNPLGVVSSDCLVGVPPHVSDDKQEEIGNYWTLSRGSKTIHVSESDLNESDIIKSNIHDLETFTSTFFEKIEVQSLVPFTAKSSEGYEVMSGTLMRFLMMTFPCLHPLDVEKRESFLITKVFL